MLRIKSKEYVLIAIIAIILIFVSSLSVSANTYNEIIKENLALVDEINTIKENFITTSNGAKIIGPKDMKNLNEKIKKYNLNLELIKFQGKSGLVSGIFYDGENGKTNYEIIEGNNEFDNEYLVKIVKELIENENIPDSLVRNLKIYISPYTLSHARGYSVIYNLEEAEDYIFISSDLNYIKENLYHELGHIYWNSVSVNNSNFKEEYRYIYKYQKFNDKIWEYNLEENFAEDFKIFLLKQEGIAPNKRTNIPYDKKVGDLIKSNYNNIKVKEGLFFPEVRLSSDKHNLSVSLKNKSLNVVYLDKEEVFISIKNPTKLKMLIQVCSANLCYETTRPSITLSGVNDYKITAFYLNNNLKLNVGELNIKKAIK